MDDAWAVVEAEAMDPDHGERRGRYRLPDGRWVGATLRYVVRGTGGQIADVYPDPGTGAAPTPNVPRCRRGDPPPGGCWLPDPPARIGRRSP